MEIRDFIQLLGLAFLTGAFWQRTGTLNATLQKMEQSFERSIAALTERVNENSDRISRIEGRLGE